LEPHLVEGSEDVFCGHVFLSERDGDHCLARGEAVVTYGSPPPFPPGERRC
jgi:hypothetical protein